MASPFANYNAHEMLNIIRYAKYIYYNKKRGVEQDRAPRYGGGFFLEHPQENTRSCTTGCWATRECSLEETMEIWNEILGNQVLVCSVAGWTVAQVLKDHH